MSIDASSRKRCRTCHADKEGDSPWTPATRAINNKCISTPVQPPPPSSTSTLLSRARELAEAGLVNEEFMQPFVTDLEGELGALEALQKSLADEAAAREDAAAALEAARAAHQRLAADFDNFRKRSAGQIASARASGKGELLESLLPLLDSLTQARGLLGLEADQEEASLNSSAASDKSEASHKDLVAALTSLARQAADLFRSAGLGVVADQGTAFDPELHEAIAREARADLPDGTVIQTLRQGYTLEGRLLRPAMVRVSYSE